MTRWLITGAAGMLGQDLVTVLRSGGAEVYGYDRAQLDITDAETIKVAMAEVRPDIVVNCAAWTAVDAAESHPDEAMAVNGDGAAGVAMACAALGARMVQMSTDYVFSGDATEPYAEDHRTGPRTAYGRTKLAGEHAVLKYLPSAGYIVRTAWLFGAHGPNFIRTMIELEGRQDEVRVVTDQTGQPTWTVDVARQVAMLADSDAQPGIYHATSSGATSWFGVAREVFGLLGADPERVRPTTTAELARPAPRPSYSVLGHDRWASAGLRPLPDWASSLRRALPDLALAAGRSAPLLRPGS